MKPLILYHGNCPDGSGAALAAWMKFRDTAEYRAASYGDPPIPDMDLNNRDVYALDFSFKKDEVLRISSIAKSLTIIDHHKTAADELKHIGQMGDLLNKAPSWTLDHKPNIHIEFDLNHSGAVLSWRHFHPGIEVPTLLLYIEDRDLWRWIMPSSEEMNAALESYGVKLDFMNVLGLFKMWENALEMSLINQGEAILRAQEALIGLMARGAVPVTIGGSPAISVNASCLQSELADHLLHTPRVWPSAMPQPPGDPIAAVWFFDGTIGRYRVSLRSRKDGPDVSEIAKQYGGGGHRNAAGFERHELPWRDRAEKVAEAARLMVMTNER